jgi:hypothetical protein
MCPCIARAKGRGDEIERHARAAIRRVHSGHIGNYTQAAVKLPRQLGAAAVEPELLAPRDQAGRSCSRSGYLGRHSSP